MSKSNKGRKFFATTATAALVASAIVPVASAAQINDFNTVSPYAQEAVQDLVDRGVIQGDEKGNFNPRKSVTRAEAATILVNVFELESTGTINFTDVKAGAWYYDAINAAVNNGIFQGQGAGKFNPSGNLTRSEAAIILVDSFGLEGTANLSQFTDSASVKAWAQEALEIAVANGVIKGDNGKLNPNAPITRQDFAVMYNRTEAAAVDPATVLVEALEDLKTTAEALVKEVKADNVAAAKTAVADAKAAITAAEEALKAAKEAEVVTEEEVKLAEEAIAAAKTALEAAEKVVAAYEESLLVFKVESASATNLKEIDVVFNRSVDVASASDKEKYTLASGSVDSAEVLADGKTVRLTVVGELTNQVANKLTVNGVKAGDKVVSQTELAFTPLDNELPKVTEVKNLGTKALKVVFSEPIEKAVVSNFTIDGKPYYGSVTEGSREVILTPYDSTTLSVGEHTITVAGVEDYFGLKALSSEHKFTVVEDKVAPKVSNVEATLENAVVTFSEEIDPSTVHATNVYWKQGDTKKYANGSKKLGSDKYAFSFTTNPLPAFETTLYVEGVKDYSGNTITETTVKVNAKVDQTRPEVTEVKADSANAKNITVKFSKAVNAADKKYFTVLDKDGKAQPILEVVAADGSNQVFTVKLYNDLKQGQNTIKISGVKDKTTLQNTMLDFESVIGVKDSTPPTIVGNPSASNSSRSVIITFSEQMDLASIANPNNYLINWSADGVAAPALRQLPTGTQVTPVQNGQAVLITFPEKLGNIAINFPEAAASIAGTVKGIQVMGVKDTTGNYLASYSVLNPISVVAAGLTAYSTSVTKNAVFTDTTTVKVKFDQAIGTASASDFTSTAGVIQSATADGSNVVTIKFASSVGTTIADNSISVVANNNMKTVNGNKVVPAGAAFTIEDQVSPVVQLAPNTTVLGNTNNTIHLPFSETLTTDASKIALFENDLIVTSLSTGKVVTLDRIATTRNADGKTIDIAITPAAGETGEYSVKVKSGAEYIQDLAGNEASESATYETARGAIDGTAPTAPTVTAPAANVLTNVGTFTFTGTAEAGSTVKIYNDLNNNGVIDATDTMVSGTATGGTYSIATPLTVNAVNKFIVTATDAAGNVSPTTVVAYTITHDGTAPAAPTATLTANTIVLAGEAGSTIKYTVAATATAQATVSASGTTYTTAITDAQVTDGDVISVVVIDAAGNETYATFTVAEATAGTIDSVNP
jgi:hypothetical protein